MNCIIKRDGRVCEYDESKISSAIFKAAKSVSGTNVVLSEELAKQVTSELDKKFNVSYPTVEDVQDMVERVLIENGHAKTAKAYILFRANRTRVREMDTKLMHSYEDLTFTHSKDSDVKRENANINTDTAMGTMLKYGSEGAKAFNCMYILDPKQATAHEQGDIHIHDLDFYSLTETCCQIGLKALLKRGFSTGHGWLRPPGSISSAASLACIAIQSNQNDQHGGQSIYDFEYGLAPYVAKSYVTEMYNHVGDIFDDFDEFDTSTLGSGDCVTEKYNYLGEPLDDPAVSERQAALQRYATFKENLTAYIQEHELIMNDEGREFIKSELRVVKPDITEKEITRLFKKVEKSVDRLTYQAAEAIVHNLNTMQSRAG